METVRPEIIQWLFSERVVSEKDVMALAEGLLGRGVDENPSKALDTFLSDIRAVLLPYQLDIKRVHASEETEEFQWVLQNVMEDRIAQLATACSAEEIDCFKLLVPLLSASIWLIYGLSYGLFPALVNIKLQHWMP